MGPHPDPSDPRALLDATRRALAACSEGLDVSAVRHDTPLAALVFDSLMALNFIVSLEAQLGARELPFERWLAEHSERTDAVTVGSLVEWLGSLPQLAAGVPPPRAARGGGAPEGA
jgi:hypothetical protein